MFIVIYRPHGELYCDTKYFGPYNTHGEAYDHLCNLPALGLAGDLEAGVKYVQPLEA